MTEFRTDCALCGGTGSVIARYKSREKLEVVERQEPCPKCIRQHMPEPHPGFAASR